MSTRTAALAAVLSFCSFTPALAQPTQPAQRATLQGRGVVARLLPDADPAGLSAAIELPAPNGRAATVEQVGLALDLRHQRRGDLQLTLTAPSGKQVVLYVGAPGDGRDHLIGAFPRSLTPVQGLEALAGEQVDGRWTLTAVDRFRGARGALIRWTLAVRAQVSSQPAARVVRQAFTARGVQALAPPAADPAPLVALGQALFFDKELAGTRDISCATCHHPSAGSTEGLAMGYGHGAKGETVHRTGTGMQLNPRNTTPVYNNGDAGYLNMFWDGRVSFDPRTRTIVSPEAELASPNPTRPEVAGLLDSALAVQALSPLANPPEMRGFPGMNEVADAADAGEAWERIMDRLIGVRDAQGAVTRGGVAGYRTMFGAAFPGTPQAQLNIGHVGLALAAFQRQAFASTTTPFDAFLRGKDDALSPAALRGAQLFVGKASCVSCHGGSHLSDFGFHALAVPQFGIGARAQGDDTGRADFTGDAADEYKFRTPPLRNVRLTGPYMHDGAYDRLEDAVRHHLDPAGMLARFDVDVLPRPEWRVNFADYRDRDPQRLAAMGPLLRNPPTLSDAEVRDLLAFLNEGLTDPTALNAEVWIPKSVPSGLPVRD